MQCVPIYMYANYYIKKYTTTLVELDENDDELYKYMHICTLILFNPIEPNFLYARRLMVQI